MNDEGERMTSGTSMGAVEFVRSAILQGTYAPGERLKETEVAKQLGVSRTPVREAFRVLEAEGLIELLTGKGARVRVYKTGDVDLIHEIRSVLEGKVAGRAALHVSNSHLTQLDASCDRLEALPVGATAECDKENQFFHGLIFEIVGNDPLTHIARRLLEVPLPYKYNYWGSAAEKNRSVAAHRRICRALWSRDAAEAEEAMSLHVSEAGKGIIRGIVDESAALEQSTN